MTANARTSQRRSARSADGAEHWGPEASRRVPAWATGVVLAIAAGGLLFAALLAGMVGPLEAHPPSFDSSPPPPRDGLKLPQQTYQPPSDRSQFEFSAAWLWWIVGIVAGLVCVALVIWVVRALRRPRRTVGVKPGRAATALSPATLGWLADEAAVDIGAERTVDVRLAADDIIASWEAVEETAAELDYPRPQASTPTEFLTRLTDRFGSPDIAATDRHGLGSNQAVGHHAGADHHTGPDSRERSAAGTLLRLYHRARFDTAALRPGAATAARTAAHALLTTWLAARATQQDAGTARDDAGTARDDAGTARDGDSGAGPAPAGPGHAAAARSAARRTGEPR